MTKKSLIARILCVVIAVLIAAAAVVFAFIVPRNDGCVTASAEEDNSINYISNIYDLTKTNEITINQFPYYLKCTIPANTTYNSYSVKIINNTENKDIPIYIAQNEIFTSTDGGEYIKPVAKGWWKGFYGDNQSSYSHPMSAADLQVTDSNNQSVDYGHNYITLSTIWTGAYPENWYISLQNTTNEAYNFILFFGKLSNLPLVSETSEDNLKYQNAQLLSIMKYYEKLITESYENGYNEGLQEGLSTAQYGYLNGATYTVTGTQNYTPTNINSSWSLTGTLPNIFVYNTINFQTIGTEIDGYFASPEKQDYQFINATITINLKTPFVYNSATTKIVENGLQSIGWTITLTDTNGDKYSISADTHYDNGGYDLQFPINAEGKEITTITAKFSGRTDLVVGTVQVGQLTYNAGYDEGYNDGYSNGETSGKIAGRQEGEEIGYNNGYQAGYSEGTAVSFANLNPVSTFLSPVAMFMETPIFGSFSVGTAFSVVLVVLLGAIFIKMFAGG